MSAVPGAVRALRSVLIAAALLCPSGASECPRGAELCGAGQCCPSAQAQCCPGGARCCPRGAACDVERGRCVTPTGETPTAAAFPAWKTQRSPTAVGDVRCDAELSCPDGNTCCRLSAGGWGCCPLRQAVCCPDRTHCCPQGYRCDPEGGSCVPGGPRLPWLTKSAALGGRGGDVRCDDTTSCPDGSTCCRMGGGAWGCCPLEQAVCCKDHQHCCPQGYTCDVATQSCEKL